MSPEAERVIEYFRQEYWPDEQRSASTLYLRRRVDGAAIGLLELSAAGFVTISLDHTCYRLTDAGVRELGFSPHLGQAPVKPPDPTCFADH